MCISRAQYGDRHVYASRSRFIPDRLTPFFDSCCVAGAGYADATGDIASAAPMPVTDIAVPGPLALAASRLRASPAVVADGVILTAYNVYYVKYRIDGLDTGNPKTP